MKHERQRQHLNGLAESLSSARQAPRPSFASYLDRTQCSEQHAHAYCPETDMWEPWAGLAFNGSKLPASITGVSIRADRFRYADLH
jgi:hypothetical protein